MEVALDPTITFVPNELISILAWPGVGGNGLVEALSPGLSLPELGVGGNSIVCSFDVVMERGWEVDMGSP